MYKIKGHLYKIIKGVDYAGFSLGRKKWSSIHDTHRLIRNQGNTEHAIQGNARLDNRLIGVVTAPNGVGMLIDTPFHCHPRRQSFQIDRVGGSLTQLKVLQGIWGSYAGRPPGVTGRLRNIRRGGY